MEKSVLLREIRNMLRVKCPGILTRSRTGTMPRHNSSVHSSKGLARRSVANLAARMMAEDGIADYGFAKRKAAKALGVGDSESLPTNDEIEAELRAYQSLFQDDELPERLRELRQIALEVMELLVDFRPYLTGAVLNGTAGRYAGIEIDLYADSAKDVEISLLSRNINYESSEPRRHGPRNSDTRPETQLHVDWQDVLITLSIHPLVSERRQRRDSSARPARARASAVAALLAQTAA
jgi:hypothetical protein